MVVDCPVINCNVQLRTRIKAISQVRRISVDQPIKFYELITDCIKIENPAVIPLILHAQWFRQSVAKEAHLRVRHALTVQGGGGYYSITRHFHRILWDELDDSKTSPYPKVRLRLKGRENDRDFFALLVLDLCHPEAGKSIMYSPLPFGTDGKPILPNLEPNYKALFLSVASVILNWEPREDPWMLDGVWKEVRDSYSVPDFTPSQADYYLNELIRLGLAKYDGAWFPKMTAERFEEVFGIRLPVPVIIF